MPLARDIIAAMAILKVIRLGHPALRTKSKEVDRKELSTKFFQKFLDDLAKTCVKNSGAGIRARVPRSKTCIVTGLDRLGKPVTYRLDYGFHARVFQPEIDHLNGIFFIDRVKRKETLSELKEWKRYWKNKKMLRSRLK